jgi:predicted ATPase
VVVPIHLEKAAEIFRYNRRVFILPPWPQIYVQDSERKQTLEEAEATYKSMITTYQGYGYELVPVPLGPIDKRVEFVIRNIGLS